MNARGYLKEYFGFENFRPGQEEIVNAVLSGKDCMVLMPTGGGKSVCYQLPALMLPGITIVISPLIALMKDQVDALKVNGIKAAFLNSSLDANAQNILLNDLQEGKIKILYIAPERLNNNISGFLDFLKRLNISLFAIDEAHCISHWGHDFRPDYMQLSILKNNFPAVPLIALTATADNLTRTDIISKLNLNAPHLLVSSFNRKNIRYIVEQKSDYVSQVIDFLNANKDQSGIIYCLSRLQTEDLAEKLTERGFPALAYHAGLDGKTRSERQEKFKRDEVKIIVATIAFGMGIDKSNVRYVIHATLPKNIESYYQETGRAGRDGLPATALLFHSHGDLMKLKNFTTVENNPEQTKIMAKKLEQMNNFCLATTCRRKLLLNYFDEKFQPPCNNCDICLGKKTSEHTFDGTLIAQKALSAIMRLKQNYGMMYVINFLKGSESAKIKDEHRWLPTFGKGAEFTGEQWKNFIRQLLENGFLRQSGEFNVLSVTETGKEVLYNDAKVQLSDLQAKKNIRSERMKKYTDQKVTAEYDAELFEILKQLRLELSRAENVAPYIIFNDLTLVMLSKEIPATLDDLKHIAGFGKIKIDRYGEDFIHVIQSYCRKKGIQARNLSLSFSTKTDKPVKPLLNETKALTYNLYLKGLSTAEIAAQRKINEGTIKEHLISYIETGQINVLKFVSKEKLQEISKAIREHGDKRLKILKDALGEAYSYDEIKATIAYQNRETSKV